MLLSLVTSPDDDPFTVERVLAPDLPLDGLRTYIAQVSRHRLLTAPEEVALGRAVQRGREPTATPDEVRAAHEAHARLVQANLRLVVALARRFAGTGAPLGDLVQEGNLGLLRAADGFDPDQGCKFSTYATWWVRQALSRAVNEHSRLIRVPSALLDERNRLVRLRAELWAEQGAAPDLEGLAMHTGHSVDRIRSLLALRHDALSLDDPLPGGSGPGGPVTCGDTATDPAPEPHEVAAEAELRFVVERELMRLSRIERQLLELRFGLDGKPPCALHEVALAIGLTKERCRTMEVELLARLRARSDRHHLHDFLVA